jgi:hypothetical protein
MRRRIGSQIFEYELLTDGLAKALRRELGIPVPYPVYWPEFLSEIALRDVLDLVTISFRLFDSARMEGASRIWLAEVQRIFVEENVHYRVDARGGVKFHFDEEFASNRAAAVAVLQAPRYANALDAFERGMAALRNVPPDGKAAIRNTFAAAEGLFRLMFPNSPRLTAQEAQRLEPLLHGTYAGNDIAVRAANKMLGSFKDWIEAAHFYRHEAGHEEPLQPPLTLTVQMISIGASFIRWLAELDASQQQ